MDNIIITFIFLIVSIISQEMGRAVLITKIYNRRNMAVNMPSSNPLHYIDIFGTLILPALSMTTGIFIGYAKSIFVDPLGSGLSRLERVLVSIGRIATSLLIALIFIILLTVSLKTGYMNNFVFFFEKIIQINIGLALFMAIPLPGFDGYRVVMSAQSRSAALKMIDFERKPSSLILSILFVIFFLSTIIVYILSHILTWIYNLINLM